jgi:hypothetical protein
MPESNEGAERILELVYERIDQVDKRIENVLNTLYPKLYTVKNISEILKITYASAYKLVTGETPALRPLEVKAGEPKGYRVTHRTLMEYIHRRDNAPELLIQLERHYSQEPDPKYRKVRRTKSTL